MGPALGRLEYTGVEQLEKAVLVGESALGLGQFAKLAVNGLNGVGGVDGGPRVIRVFEIGRE